MADDHTYYVGENGVLVHNTCQSGTAYDLYSFGNKSSPRGARLVDFKVESFDTILQLKALIEARADYLSCKAPTAARADARARAVTQLGGKSAATN